MQSLKHIFQYVLLLFFFLVSCGEDHYTKGVELYNQGNYDASIKHLLAARNDQKNNNEYLEILALAYMYKSQVLYKKTKNVKAFIGNYEKAKKIMPENSTSEFNKKHSQILYSLANAFLKAKDHNTREKDKFYSDAIKYLQTSILLDSTNSESPRLLAQLKEADFKNLLDRAEKLYLKANKTGNIDLYFIAKSYLQNAMLFNPDDKRLNQLKSRIRRKLLGILDDRDGLAIAITNTMRKKEVLTLKIAVKNYLNKNQSIDPYRFHLINSNGEDFLPNEKEMGLLSFLSQKSLKPGILSPENSYMEGILIYKIPVSTSAHYIVYQGLSKEISRKYFY